jgi:hypothetical protein
MYVYVRDGGTPLRTVMSVSGRREAVLRCKLRSHDSEGHSGDATLIQNERKRYTPHTLPPPKPQSFHVATTERKTEDKEQEKQLLGRLVVINGLLAKSELNGSDCA